jgi:hypothetical protein
MRASHAVSFLAVTATSAPGELQGADRRVPNSKLITPT